VAKKKKKTVDLPPFRKGSMSEMIYRAIAAGRSNAQIQEQLAHEFGDHPRRKYYASWYRASAVRRGFVTKEFAKEHR